MSVLKRLEANKGTTRVGVFDRSFPPLMTISSGTTIDIETATHWGDAITPETTLDDIIELRTKKYPDVGPHTLTGPVEIDGARPGQTLRVDVVKLVPREHGFNLYYPGAYGTGLLPEEQDLRDGNVRHFQHDLGEMTTSFAAGIEIPLRPFLGIMGVAPKDAGSHSTVPPGLYGGNMDLPELEEGSTLYLPVWVEGARFSIGDAHSRQGQGEVCLTAIETAMREAHLRLSVEERWKLSQPRAETADCWITMGFHEDLLEAARIAVRDMIRLLKEEYDVAAKDAYPLCSISVDLVVTQVVNKMRGVHARLPKSIFGS